MVLFGDVMTLRKFVHVAPIRKLANCLGWLPLQLR